MGEWAAVARAAVDKLGPWGLCIASAIGGSLWLESQQPGTVGGWAAGVATYLGPVGMLGLLLFGVLAFVALTLYRRGERVLTQLSEDVRSMADPLREIAQAHKDGGVIIERHTDTIERLAETVRACQK